MSDYYEYDYPYEDLEEAPEVHPDQTAIPPDGPYLSGSIGTCHWCSQPATFGNLDIGLPKRANQPRVMVSACAHHYHATVAPSLQARADERERKRRDAMAARRGY